MDFGLKKKSRSKPHFECSHMCRHFHTHMHINHLSLRYVLMRQEHEGCMGCMRIANVIPSHQMACFRGCFFFCKNILLFPYLLSFLLLLLLFSDSLPFHPSHPFFFTIRLDFIYHRYYICGFTSCFHSSVVLLQHPFFSLSPLFFTSSLFPIVCS